MFNLAWKRPKVLSFLPSFRFWQSKWWAKPLLVLVLAITLIGLLSLVQPAAADAPKWVKEYVFPSLAYILEIIASLIVSILLWVIHYIIILSGYNNFLNARVVSIGWSLTRDVANMFYILIMLIIAFGTMFKIEQYSWKKLLPRLILTAVLVNFSKTIVGLFIDFAQVIMLTFVNGYAAAAGGNFVTMFGLDEMFRVSTEGPSWGEAITSGALLAYLLGAVLLGVALIVTAVFAAILLFRIITLWVLIVLAPLAFMLGTFPKGQEYYADWWKRLTNQIIVGPMIAFFLWLSLAAMGGGNQYGQLTEGSALSPELREGTRAEEKIGKEMVTPEGAPTEIAKWENLGSFAVCIAMLFVALQFTQQLGVAGAGLASGAAGWMKQQGVKWAKRAAVPAALGLGVPIAPALGLGAMYGAGKGAWFGAKKGIGKGVGSWEKGTGLVGMAKDVYTRAGSYIEKKGYERRGVGKIYGWKYHLGKLSEERAEKAKEEAEYAKQRAAGRAREEIEKERKEPRIAHEQKAVLARVNKYQEDYGAMEFTELMTALRGSVEEIKRKKGDPDANARMLAVLKLAASDGRIDDENADLGIVKELFGDKEIKEEKDSEGKVVKRSVDVTGESQRRMLLKHMFNLGPEDKITEAMLDDPVFQGNLAVLEDLGRTGSKIGHFQFSKMRVLDEKKGRYTINGLQKQPDGTWDYTKKTDETIRAAQETEMGKRTYLGDSAPQSFFDHRVEYNYDKDGKLVETRMKRVMEKDGGKDIFSKSNLSGLSYRDVGRKQIQKRTKVDLLEGNLSDKFLNIDPNGVLTAADDFLEKLRAFPGVMALAMIEAKSEKAQIIKYKDAKGEVKEFNISDLNGENADRKVQTLLGVKAVEAPEPLTQRVAKEAQAVTPREVRSKISELGSDEKGNTPSDLQADLREVLSIPPATNLDDLKTLPGDLGKQVDKLVDAAGKFGATMEKAAAVIGKTIHENVQAANPMMVSPLDQRLRDILRELRKKLMVKGGDRDKLNQNMNALIAEVETAQKIPPT